MTTWKSEAQFKRKVVEELRRRGYLVYHIEAGVGATNGLPDLMVINKYGVVRFIETKCIPRSILMNADKTPDKRFKFNGMQMGRFEEMWGNKKDVWIMIAHKNYNKASAILFRDIGKKNLISSGDLKYLLNAMRFDW